MSKLKGMILGAYIGDALALGMHWIYDQEDIKSKWAGLETMTYPHAPYHACKVAGDFTHYGDQALFFHKYLKDGYSLTREKFYEKYYIFMSQYMGYRDHASQTTLDRIKTQTQGSKSNELGGATSLFTCLYFSYPNMDKALEAVDLRVSLTHDDWPLRQRANFLVQWTQGILGGGRPSDVLYKLMDKAAEVVKADLIKAEQVLAYGPAYAIKTLGQTCDSNQAFPGVLYLVLKYEKDFEAALINNVYGGGDSAARGMIVGGLLGAYYGEKNLPIHWLARMTHLKTLEDLLT